MYKVDTGDNSEIRKAKWCEHREVHQIRIRGTNEVALRAHQDVYLIVESGILKILCPSCFQTAVDPSSFTKSVSH